MFSNSLQNRAILQGHFLIIFNLEEGFPKNTNMTPLLLLPWAKQCEIVLEHPLLFCYESYNNLPTPERLSHVIPLKPPKPAK